jgi:hypothetical protein
MDLETLLDTPPWEWPREAGKLIHSFLIDHRASETDRLTAAELAGELVVMSEEQAEALLAIVRSDDEPEQLRAKAAISLGPVLEQASNEEWEGEFEDPEAVPITLPMFREIQSTLHKLYTNEKTPREVRRRILEASVRAQEDWHRSVVGAAYSSGDRDWMLTAVFSMGYIRGFDGQILEALENPDPDIHYEAVKAAGNWELDAAWPQVVKLVQDPATPKELLLVAIEAAGNIRPQEAGKVLADLAGSDDDEIADAADEAMELAAGRADEEEEEDQDGDEGEESAGEWLN